MSESFDIFHFPIETIISESLDSSAFVRIHWTFCRVVMEKKSDYFLIYLFLNDSSEVSWFKNSIVYVFKPSLY